VKHTRYQADHNYCADGYVGMKTLCTLRMSVGDRIPQLKTVPTASKISRHKNFSITHCAFFTTLKSAAVGPY